MHCGLGTGIVGTPVEDVPVHDGMVQIGVNQSLCWSSVELAVVEKILGYASLAMHLDEHGVTVVEWKL